MTKDSHLDDLDALIAEDTKAHGEVPTIEPEEEGPSVDELAAELDALEAR